MNQRNQYTPSIDQNYHQQLDNKQYKQPNYNHLNTDELTSHIDKLSNALSNNQQQSKLQQPKQVGEDHTINQLRQVAQELLDMGNFDQSESSFTYKPFPQKQSQPINNHQEKNERVDRLINRLIDKKKASMEKIDNKRMIKEQHEREIFSHKPSINNMSREIMSNNPSTFMDRQADYIRKKQSLQRQSISGNLTGSTVNSKQKKISQEEFNKFLEHQKQWSKQKNLKIQNLSNEKLRKDLSYSFVPSIDRNSQGLALKTINQHGKYVPIHSRIDGYVQQKEENIKKLKESLDNQYSYTPRINRKSRKQSNESREVSPQFGFTQNRDYQIVQPGGVLYQMETGEEMSRYVKTLQLKFKK